MFSNLKPVFEKATPLVGEIFSGTGLNGYINYTFVRDPIKETLHAGTGFLDDVENHNPDMFANLGSNIGMAGTSFLTSGMMGYGIYAGLRNARIANGAEKAWRSGSHYFTANKGIMSTYKKGLFGKIEHSATQYVGEKYIAEEIARKGVRSGYLNIGKGKFFKPSMGLGANIAWTVGLTLAGIGASMAMSSIGSWIDRASKFDLDRRRHHYDSREFYGVGKYLQSMNDTYNQSMQQYESKLNLSTARAYHHRG